MSTQRSVVVRLGAAEGLDPEDVPTVIAPSGPYRMRRLDETRTVVVAQVPDPDVVHMDQVAEDLLEDEPTEEIVVEDHRLVALANGLTLFCVFLAVAIGAMAVWPHLP